MNQADFIASGANLSQTDKLINYLHMAEGQWVGLPTLVSVCGGFAIHSRASDAKRRGVNIENRVENINGKKHSFYRILAP